MKRIIPRKRDRLLDIHRSIIEFFTKLRENYPLTENKHIHIILDGAGYHRSEVVVEKALEMGIVLDYLPPYSPNLNPIERLWKVMNERWRNNQYFPSKDKFREAVLGFSENILPTIIPELRKRLTDNFQVLKPAS